MSNSRLPLGSLLGFATSGRFGDVTGDGLPDLVVSIMYTANKLIINHGPDRRMRDETLARLPQLDRASEEAALGDLDHDGDLDLIVANAGQTGSELLINDGTGRFEARQNEFPIMSSNSVDIADLNGDGRNDVIFGNSGRTRLFVGTRDGFEDVSDRSLPPFEGETNDIAVADVNGDGHRDLFLANSGPHRVWLNDGHGRFRDLEGAVPVPTGTEETWSVALGDIDGDGDLDAALGNVAFVVPDAQLQSRVLINRGDGKFQDETSDRLPVRLVNTPAVAFVDYDQNGTLDLIAGSFVDDAWGRRHDAPWRVYRNDGTGRFTDETAEVFPPTTTGNARYIEASDVNGDNVPDLFLASRGGPSLLLITRRSTELPRP